MKKHFLLILLFLLLNRPAAAHRLDEYLQATILSIEPGAVSLTLRLVPGVAVAPRIITDIDRNGDGLLSDDEQRTYAEHVVADLSLKEDGQPLGLRIGSVSYPSISAMQSGGGEIELALVANFSASSGKHQISFENHHQSGISVYLVNTLVPSEKNLVIDEQSRNLNQSSYEVTFTRTNSAQSPSRPFTLSGFSGAFRLGMRHISEGTDHLLFLLTLLLPAPLLACTGRWCQTASIRKSMLQILRIVTAFTLGHSLTLALAGFGVVQLPSQPVEVLIAISILVSAIHALRPIFPGKEAIVAAFFGLIHGLAFASALSELGMTGWYRLVSIFGFNLGIETMQLAVVAVTLPSLILLSRTRWYTLFRVCGGLFAACTSTAWIAERITGRTNRISYLVEQIAHEGGNIALALFLISLLAWLGQHHFKVQLRESARHGV